MKRLLPLLVMLGFTVTASRAPAAGLCLRWDQCYADGGTTNKAFACDVNTGTERLVGSVFITKDSPQRSGVEFTVHVATAGATVPAWWQFRNAGTCRPTAMSIVPTVPPGAVGCLDWYSGQASGGLAAYTIGSKGPNIATIIGGIGLPQSALADLAKGNEYYLFTIDISNTKTVGTGSCAGCNTPACIIFSSGKLVTPFGSGGTDHWFGYPIDGTDSNYVTWQGGAGITTGIGVGCPAAVPTRKSTWGAVKTLYR